MDKLQGLHQKNLSVEEYWQKMAIYIKMAGINEDNYTTMSRFLSGLKPYRDLNDFIQLSIKVWENNQVKSKVHTLYLMTRMSSKEGKNI